MSTHPTTVLAELSGTLMSLDIDDVEAGDIMFMGGHLVRRVWTRPRDRTYRQSTTFRTWQGLKLDQPTDGSVARGEFQTAIGTAVLIFRESEPKVWEHLPSEDVAFTSSGVIRNGVMTEYEA
jgi:hypothetical protein